MKFHIPTIKYLDQFKDSKSFLYLSTRVKAKSIARRPIEHSDRKKIIPTWMYALIGNLSESTYLANTVIKLQIATTEEKYILEHEANTYG